MVGKILDCVGELSPMRFCAVITYTNAATENIKTRIEKQISIPQNVFIGTTHSFLIKFIIEPYAHLFGITPPEKYYIEAARLLSEPQNPFVKKALERNTAEALLTNGLITYDKVLEKSFELLKIASIKQRVSNRLQFIFLDEYQDSRLYQHMIIEELLQQCKTKLYCIGDPLLSRAKTIPQSGP